MALEDEVKRTNELFAEFIRQQGGGGAAATPRGSVPSPADIESELQKTRTNFIKFNINAQNWSKGTQLGSFAAGLFGKETKAAARQMGDLHSALDKNEQMLDTLRKSGEKKYAQEIKELEANIKGIESQIGLRKNVTMLSGTVSEGAKSLFSFSNQMMMINAQYSAEMMGIMAEGGSGFQMMGAAMKNGVERVNAANQAMAKFAQTAGQALSQMGGKFAPLAGMALQVMGQRAAAASEAQKILAEKSISILVAEGEKLIKTQQEMTSSGLIFANGLDGMVTATSGTKLRLEDMAAVVKENRDAFVDSGIGMVEATRRVGEMSKLFASTTGQFKNMDRALLALGYSYKEQAALGAEVLADAGRSADGQRLSTQKLGSITAEYAKNLTLISDITGKDAKRAEAELKAKNRNIAFEQEMATKSTEERKAINAAMLLGSKSDQDALREKIINHGVVVDAGLNVYRSQNSAASAKQDEMYKLMQQGKLNAETMNQLNKKYNGDIRKNNLENNRVMGQASFLGKGGPAVSKAAEYMMDTAEYTNKVTKEAIDSASTNIKEAADKAQTGADTGAQKAAIDAIQAGAVGAKKLQEAAVAKLKELAPALEKQYIDQIAALKGLSTGIESNTDKMGLLILALMAANFGKDIFKAGQGIFEKFRNVKNLPGSGTISTATTAVKDTVKGVLTSLKGGEAASGLASGATKGSKAMTAAFEATAKVTGPLSKATGFLAKNVKSLGVVGTVITTGLAAYNVMDKQKDYEAAKAAGDQESMDAARKAQGGSIGGAIGGVTGGALGFALGGPIGAAIGAYLGDMAGSWAGEYVGPYWDKMTAKMGEWYSSAAAGASAMWQGISSWATGKWTELGGFMTGVIDKFPTSFAEAKTMATDFVKNTKEKFNTTFPELYKDLENVFGKISSIITGMLDSVTKVASNSWNWIKEKTGFGGNKATAQQPAATTQTAAPVSAAPSATPGATAAVNSATKIQPGALPEKKGLTAQEKAAVMETVATNTKYTNDLLINYTKNAEKLQIQMLQKLDLIAGHSSDTAGAAKKTAKNTG